MKTNTLEIHFVLAILVVTIVFICVSPVTSQNTPTLTLINAPRGKDGPTSITYGHLFKDGKTSYKEIDPHIIGPLPPGYTAYNGVSYDIRTTGVASGPHIVTFHMPSVTDRATFNSLRVLHSEPDVYDDRQAVWVERTILPPGSPSSDFDNRNIYARVNEVGPFLIARYKAPPPNPNIADLSVSTEASPDPAIAGDRLTYTVNIKNIGPNAATQAFLSNGMSDTGFISATPSQGECRYDSGWLMCKLGAIAPRTTVSVRIIVMLREDPFFYPRDGKARIASLMFVRANEKDPNPDNNQDNKIVIVLPKPITRTTN